MRVLYEFKWPLSLFLLGVIGRITGVMMKIMHWSYADILLVAGTAIMVIAVVWSIIKLLLLKPGPKRS